MTPNPSGLPDITSYVDLIDGFIGRDISAPDFGKPFLRAMKSERRILGDPVYPVLQELFEDADAYVEQAELRTEPDDLDDEQLLASALRARHALRGLGYMVRPSVMDLGLRDWYGVHPMSDQTSWRPISSEEAAVIRSILSQADIRRRGPLIADLDGALVANDTQWILDVKVSNNYEGVDLPNGPFPAHAFVPNSAEYEGEVIIWISDGHLSGLEYAWVSDDPPTRWPRADEMEVVVRASSQGHGKDARGRNG